MAFLNRLFLVLAFLSGTSLWGFSQVLIASTNYSTLDNAFNAINSGTHTGNITVFITSSSTLTSIASLSASGSGSASYSSVTIKPSGGNYTISGNINGPLISLVGADNVTIDGLNSSGQSLTISNSNTSGGMAIRLSSGATSNTITRCTLLGSGAGYCGVITFAKNGSTTNSNNTISYCNIGDASGGTPAYGILADGEAGSAPGFQYSSSITISNNNIYNYSANNSHSLGIYILDGHSGWTIQSNRFYQTASRSITNSTGVTKYHGAIWIYSITYSSTFDVSNNVVGYSNSSGTGTYTISTATATSLIDFFAITIVTGSASVTANVNGNQIQNISVTSVEYTLPFIGIFANTGAVNIGNTSGNTISGITISLTYSAASTLIPVCGIYYNGTTGIVDNNTISNTSVSYGGSLSGQAISFYGIYCIGTASSVSGNTVGSTSAFHDIIVGPGSGTDNASHRMKGIYINSSSAPTINNNTTGGFALRAIGTDAYAGGIDLSISSGSITITNNTVKNLDSYSARSSSTVNPSVYGINLTSTSSGNIMYGNRISGLKNINSTSGNTPAVVGVLLTAGTSSNSSFYSNALYDLGVISGTPGSYCNYLYISSGNWNVNNNMISACNSYNKTLNNLEVAGGTINLYYNSMFIGGSTSFASTSVNLKRTGGTVVSVDNIFFNERSTASGGWSGSLMLPSTSNYSPNFNLYVCPDTSMLFYNSSATTYHSYYDYYTNLFTSERAGWAELSSQISSSSFFLSTSTGNLSIDSTSALCWYVNGKAWPMAAYSYDYSQITGLRSNSVSTGAPDIGADEFSTTTTPIAARHVGSYTTGSTSYYYFGGRVITEINWQSGSNLPSTPPTVLFYTGTNPPYPISGTKYMNAYWHISATDPGGMSYTLKLRYSDALLYNITSSANIRMAKNSGTTSADWGYALSTNVDATNKTFNNPSIYSSFSFFTGTDSSNPLPVEWLDFKTTESGKDVLLQWTTASETNNSHFDIERSFNGRLFETIGTVAGHHNSNQENHYTYTDKGLLPSTGTIYYRIKQVDLNAEYTYSTIELVKPTSLSGTISIFPNPFRGVITVKCDENKTGEMFISVADMDGKIVFTQQAQLTNDNHSITLEEMGKLKKGMYFITVLFNGETSRLKIVAQ